MILCVKTLSLRIYFFMLEIPTLHGQELMDREILCPLHFRSPGQETNGLCCLNPGSSRFQTIRRAGSNNNKITDLHLTNYLVPSQGR